MSFTTTIRLTQQHIILTNIPLKKIMAIVASEYLAIYGNLDNVHILQTSVTVENITKIAPCVILETMYSHVNTPFQNFYLKFLYKLCVTNDLEEDIKAHIEQKFIIVSEEVYPAIKQKLDHAIQSKWIGYQPKSTYSSNEDQELTFLNAFRCVLDHPFKPKKATLLATSTHMYHVKKLTIDLCMAIYGLNWVFEDTDITKDFIKRHKYSYSIITQ